MKTCTRCNETKPATEFNSGYSRCKPCIKQYAAEWYQKNKEAVLSKCRAYRSSNKGKSRGAYLRLRYDLTEQQHDALLLSQNGGCAICLTKTPGGKGTWHVDHCHTTGAVRGLLCARCNMAIGLLNDDANLLRAAADYLDSRK